MVNQVASEWLVEQKKQKKPHSWQTQKHYWNNPIHQHCCQEISCFHETFLRLHGQIPSSGSCKLWHTTMPPLSSPGNLQVTWLPQLILHLLDQSSPHANIPVHTTNSWQPSCQGLFFKNHALRDLRTLSHGQGFKFKAGLSWLVCHLGTQRGLSWVHKWLNLTDCVIEQKRIPLDVCYVVFPQMASWVCPNDDCITQPISCLGESLPKLDLL